MPLHNCAPAWSEKHENFQGYGSAVDICTENDKGELWVSNLEYSSRVNFCPFCGYRAPSQVDALPEPPK